MKFILGLLIGAGLIFWVYYMGGGSKEMVKASATLEADRKADAEILAAEKVKIRADYEVQLKAAEDRVENLNKELLKTRADLATARAKLTNMVETVYVSPRLEPSTKNNAAPVVYAPPTVSAPSAIAQPAPAQPRQVTPVKKEGLRGPRPAPGGTWFRDTIGSRRYRIINGQRVYE
ncbi:MAG: hypothetical protein WC381_09955 [Kiritimatiellia bacterium]|jgi:hypothetical protein